jgi:hypothetical protein
MILDGSRRGESKYGLRFRCFFNHGPGIRAIVREAIVLLSIILLAGCLSGGNPATPQVGDGPPEAGWTDGDGLNVTALANSHFETLRSEGSFTLNRTSTIAINGETRPEKPRPDWYAPPSSTHASVNLREGRLRHESTTVGHSQATRFVSAEETAQRRKPCSTDACDWEYRYLVRPEHDTSAQLIDRYRRDRVVEMMIQVMDDWNYTYAGTTDRDGRTVYRYTAEWTFEKPVHPFDEVPSGTGTLLVSENGVIHYWEYRYSGTATVTVAGEQREVSVTQRSTQTYSDVGDVTIVRPDWVDRARERNPPRTTESADQ